MQKKYGLSRFVFIFGVILLQLVAAFEVHAGPNVIIDSKVDVVQGETVNISISASNFVAAEKVAGARFEVSFDSTFLTLGDPVAGADLAPHFIFSAPLLTDNKMQINILPPGNPATTPPEDIPLMGGGELVVIPVTVAENTPEGRYSLTLSKVRFGTALQQVVDGGTVTDGSIQVVVVVSDVIVPNVVGQTQATATATLEADDLGLVVAISNANHATVPSGNVISQSIAAGEFTVPGTSINLVISIGPEPTTPTEQVNVPNVVGKMKGEAIAILKGLGFEVTTTRIHSSTVPSGEVISQHEVIAAASPVTAVTLVATAALVAMTAPVVVAVPVAAALITVAAPAIAEAAPLGSTVNLVISAGQAPLPSAQSAEQIPTLSFWGLLGLSALMPVIVGFMSRRKSRK